MPGIMPGRWRCLAGRPGTDMRLLIVRFRTPTVRQRTPVLLPDTVHGGNIL
ncbi:MAG: hypothetical protein JXQ27_04130 [Acidobacteria bacterium]|nr:hypothetical protein [Acidobacteriota bacterium]